MSSVPLSPSGQTLTERKGIIMLDFHDELDPDMLEQAWEACESEQDDFEDDWDFDESMDGDHDSAMESAGWGTDEDYGYYGEDY